MAPTVAGGSRMAAGGCGVGGGVGGRGAGWLECRQRERGGGGGGGGGEPKRSPPAAARRWVRAVVVGGWGGNPHVSIYPRGGGGVGGAASCGVAAAATARARGAGVQTRLATPPPAAGGGASTQRAARRRMSGPAFPGRPFAVILPAPTVAGGREGGVDRPSHPFPLCVRPRHAPRWQTSSPKQGGKGEQGGRATGLAGWTHGFAAPPRPPTHRDRAASRCRRSGRHGAVGGSKNRAVTPPSSACRVSAVRVGRACGCAAKGGSRGGPPVGRASWGRSFWPAVEQRQPLFHGPACYFCARSVGMPWQRKSTPTLSFPTAAGDMDLITTPPGSSHPHRPTRAAFRDRRSSP